MLGKPLIADIESLGSMTTMSDLPPYDAEKAYAEWSRIPVDDFDYMTAEDLMILAPQQFRELVEMTGGARFDRLGWRNEDGLLERFMLGSGVQDKTVVDFGCGLGIDACSFTMHGAQVTLADMHPKMLLVAQYTMIAKTSFIPNRLMVISLRWPYFIIKDVDLFWSLGVLHHTPHIGKILERMCGSLRAGGECRIVLYSDRRWEEMMGEPVPSEPTWKHPRFDEFVKKCDTVGQYADWYNAEKIAALVEPFGELVSCEYLCRGQMVGAVIKPKVK